MANSIGNLSFPKEERLLKNPEFVRIQKQGKRFYSKHFILVVAKDENIKFSKHKNRPGQTGSLNQKNVSKARLGITITNKIEASAVKRNRVKRIIRAAFRQIKGRCLTGIAILVIAKSGASELGSQEVQKQLFAALNYNGFIHKNP